jgi:hypothetical protein
MRHGRVQANAMERGSVPKTQEKMRRFPELVKAARHGLKGESGPRCIAHDHGLRWMEQKATHCRSGYSGYPPSHLCLDPEYR